MQFFHIFLFSASLLAATSPAFPAPGPEQRTSTTDVVRTEEVQNHNRYQATQDLESLNLSPTQHEMLEQVLEAANSQSMPLNSDEQEQFFAILDSLNIPREAVVKPNPGIDIEKRMPRSTQQGKRGTQSKDPVTPNKVPKYNTYGSGGGPNVSYRGPSACIVDDDCGWLGFDFWIRKCNAGGWCTTHWPWSE